VEKQEFQKLIEKLPLSEQEEGKTLWVAERDAHNAFRASKTKADLERWRSIKAELEAFIARALAKTNPAEPPLKNLTAAVQHLQDQGWKIKKSKVYNDAKAGLLRVQPDRTVARADLDSYILRAGLEKTSQADVGGKIEQGQAERLELENEKLRKQVEKLEWELARDKGKYVAKEEVHVELAIRAGALEAGVKHWMRTGAVDLVYAVGGEPAKARVLINLFEARLDELLDEYARAEAIGVMVSRHRPETEDQPPTHNPPPTTHNPQPPT